MFFYMVDVSVPVLSHVDIAFCRKSIHAEGGRDSSAFSCSSLLTEQSGFLTNQLGMKKIRSRLLTSYFYACIG